MPVIVDKDRPIMPRRGAKITATTKITAPSGPERYKYQGMLKNPSKDLKKLSCLISITKAKRLEPVAQLIKEARKGEFICVF